ncbi:MAG: antibiotic biosynthesis monooxygenase [Actinomycetota bacterium]|nr:antibiotic biosynthesis monooxygenase [Actinomycetota bacterium]
MYTRLFYGTIQPGKHDEAWSVLDDVIPKVKGEPGCVLLQVLQGGDEIIGISSWATREDLAAYADGEVAKELFSRLTPLLMGMPTTRSYDVKVNLWEPAATEAV